MPSDRDNTDYLKRIGAFLKSVCNFSCNARPSFENIKQIYGSASLTLKEGEKSVPVPVLIEAEVHEDGKVKAGRISLRGGNGAMLTSIYQLFITFFG